MSTAHEDYVRRLAKRIDCRLVKSRRRADNWDGQSSETTPTLI
jgi:hypothetical protein